MASLNPESDISAFVNSIFEQAILVARDNNVMSSLVRVFNDRTGLAVRSNQQYGGATMNSIAETDDLVGQAFTPSAIATLTPAEVGAQYFLTDSRIESDPFSVRNDAAQDLGQAVATKIETSLLSDFYGDLTGGTVGTTASILTWPYVLAMQAQLRNQLAPLPYSFVCSPYQWYQLTKAASLAGSASNAPTTMLETFKDNPFYVGTNYGINFFVSGNVETSSNDSYTGMFSRDAIALDIRRPPRLEVERDASRRGWELNMSCVFAHGVWRPLFGIAGIFLNTAPTGV